MLRIYLDVCCLCRPFDDQSQDRIRLEAESVLLILNHVLAGDWELVGSEVIEFEIGRVPDRSLKERLEEMAMLAGSYITLEEEQVVRAQDLESLGFGEFDALHLACAETAQANVFLSTDDQLLRVASRVTKTVRVRVANPMAWIAEIEKT